MPPNGCSSARPPAEARRLLLQGACRSKARVAASCWAVASAPASKSGIVNSGGCSTSLYSYSSRNSLLARFSESLKRIQSIHAFWPIQLIQNSAWVFPVRIAPPSRCSFVPDPPTYSGFSFRNVTSASFSHLPPIELLSVRQARIASEQLDASD